jgi:glycosyltransferase involved in cell wall biosynthesis
MQLKGFYIINTNIANHMAHSIQVFKTIEGMRASGLDIELVCPRYMKVDLQEIFSDYVITENFPVHQLWVLGSKPSKIALVSYVFVAGTWLIYKSLSQKVSFVYLRSEYLFPLVPLCKLIKIPYFYELHRVGLHARAQRIKVFVATYTKGLIVLTEVLKKKFTDDQSNILVEHDAVSVDHIQTNESVIGARCSMGIDGDATVVLYAGSVQLLKGIDILLRVASSFPDIQFHLAGRVHKDMESLLSLAPSNVYQHGQFTQAEIPFYLKAADLLVLPHPAGPQSQSPMKLFEYLASGKPVLSADLSNIREVLPPENLFYQPGSVESFCEQLQNFTNNEFDSELVKKVNIERAHKHSWKNRGRRITSFIHETLLKKD